MTDDEITGKQLLSEFESLLRDTSVYLYKVGKRVCVGVKKAFDAADEKRENSDVATATNGTEISK